MDRENKVSLGLQKVIMEVGSSIRVSEYTADVYCENFKTSRWDGLLLHLGECANIDGTQVKWALQFKQRLRTSSSPSLKAIIK